MKKQVHNAGPCRPAWQKCNSASNRHRTPQQRVHQRRSRADNALFIVSLVALMVYALLSLLLAATYFLTKNYDMFSIIIVMAHELGYIVRCMVEPIYMQKRSQNKASGDAEI